MHNVRSVLVLNEGNSDNLGDQAINKSICYLLKKNNIENFYTENLTKNLSNIEKIKDEIQKKSIVKELLKKVYPKRFGWFLRNILRVVSISKKKYDVILIGGGQLLLANKTFPISLVCWVMVLKIFGHKNIFMIGIGANEKFNYIDKKLIHYVLKNIDGIYLRDEKSQKIIKHEFGISSDYIEDIAFLYSKIYKEDPIYSNRILLGVVSFKNVFKVYNKENITEEAYYELYVDLLNKYSILLDSVVLFYTTSDDLVESKKFKEYIYQKYNKSLLLIKTMTLNELIVEINASETIVSGRMHALILGLSYNKDIVTFKISKKLAQFDIGYANNNFNLVETQKGIERKFDKILKMVDC